MPRRFGQHFLKHVPPDLLPDWTLSSNHRVLEIGPGKGSVTFALLKSFQKQASIQPDQHLDVTLVEVDDQLAQALQPRLAAYESRQVQIELHNLSILDFDLKEFFNSIASNTITWIISSLPYDISKQIIKKIIDEFLSSKNNTEQIYCRFIIQREVGEAYAAQPPRATFLSNWLQLYAVDIRARGVIKPREFSPPPKVDSIVLTYTLTALSLTPSQKSALVAFLRRCFASPRKIIKQAFPKNSAVMTDTTVANLFTKRPGELHLTDWLKLLKTVDTVL